MKYMIVPGRWDCVPEEPKLIFVRVLAWLQLADDLILPPNYVIISMQ